jgi:hypothetical protein
LTRHREHQAGMRGIPRGWRKSLALLLGALMLFTCAPVGWTQANPPSEYQLKAAFLFNFAKFVDWPAGNFASPDSPFAICILGSDPFGHSIDDTLQGKMIGEHPVTIQRTMEPEEDRHCQIVFISSTEVRRLPEILASFHGAGILLVGDVQGFAASGGDIELTLEENRVRFAINPDATQRAGLKISSKLLALARIVHDEGPSKGA